MARASGSGFSSTEELFTEFSSSLIPPAEVAVGLSLDGGSDDLRDSEERGM